MTPCSRADARWRFRCWPRRLSGRWTSKAFAHSQGPCAFSKPLRQDENGARALIAKDTCGATVTVRVAIEGRANASSCARRRVLRGMLSDAEGAGGSDVGTAHRPLCGPPEEGNVSFGKCWSGGRSEAPVTGAVGGAAWPGGGGVRWRMVSPRLVRARPTNDGRRSRWPPVRVRGAFPGSSTAAGCRSPHRDGRTAVTPAMRRAQGCRVAVRSPPGDGSSWRGSP